MKEVDKEQGVVPVHHSERALVHPLAAANALTHASDGLLCLSPHATRFRGAISRDPAHGEQSSQVRFRYRVWRPTRVLVAASFCIAASDTNDSSPILVQCASDR